MKCLEQGLARGDCTINGNNNLAIYYITVYTKGFRNKYSNFIYLLNIINTENLFLLEQLIWLYTYEKTSVKYFIKGER